MIELVAELGLEPIRVGARRLDSSETGFVKVLFEVEGVRPDKLWFAVDSDYADWVSDSYDAVAVALLLPAMMAGRSLVLDGPVSARLYWSITSQVIPLLAQFFPATKRIEVIAAGNAPPTRGNAVVTGFSAGVDSFNVVLDHHAVDSVPESLRLTHLLFNDVGSHGRRRKGDLVERRWDGVARAAATLSLPLIRTHSNVNAFYEVEFWSSHTVRNASVPLFLAGGIRRWLYASGEPYSRIGVDDSRNISRIDPILLPLLQTDSLDLVAVGQQLSRIEKIARIVDYPPVWEHLDVCLKEHPNCSKCEKCKRTLVTMELLGALESFSEVFNLETYRRVRTAYLPKVKLSSDPKMRGISDLMGRAGLRTTPSMWAQLAKTEAKRGLIRARRRLLRSS